MTENTIYGPEWGVICPRCGDVTEGYEVDEDNRVVCGDDWRPDTGCGAELKVSVEVVEDE